MTEQDTNLARLEKMIALVDGSLTKDEFVTAFEEVMKLVLRIEKRNADAVDLIEQTWGKMYGKMQNDHSMTLSEMKAGVDELFVGEQLRKIKEDLTAKIDIKLAEVKDGKTPTEKELKALIVPLIPPPKKSKDGSPDTPAQVRDKLETLKDEDRLDASAIKGLEKRLKKLENTTTYSGASIGSGGNVVRAYDLSSSLDGSTRTFALPAFWRVISVHLSSFPNILRPTTDYTTDGSAFTLTFTSEIPDNSISTGQTCIITYATTV